MARLNKLPTIALWAPLGFWGVVTLASGRWLLEMIDFRFSLFLAIGLAGVIFFLLSYFVNFFLLKKLAKGSFKKAVIISTVVSVLVNGLFLFVVFPTYYLIMAFATWDGHF